MNNRRPSLLVTILTYVALIALCTVILYPVLLILKKAIEPGRQFSLSISPIPSEVTTSHFGELFLHRYGMTPGEYRRAGRRRTATPRD